MMRMDCPSSTGNGMRPKSSTTWCVWLSKPACVQLKLPTTVAVAGLAGGWSWVEGGAADQGGVVAPEGVAGKTRVPGSSARADRADALHACAPPGCGAWLAHCCGGTSGGSCSQVNCSSIG